jgi:hypothetical protein
LAQHQNWTVDAIQPDPCTPRDGVFGEGEARFVMFMGVRFPLTVLERTVSSQFLPSWPTAKHVIERLPFAAMNQ